MVRSRLPRSRARQDVGAWLGERSPKHGPCVRSLVDSYLADHPQALLVAQGDETQLQQQQQQVYDYVATEYKSAVGIITWWFIKQFIWYLVQELLTLYNEQPEYRP